MREQPKFLKGPVSNSTFHFLFHHFVLTFITSTLQDTYPALGFEGSSAYDATDIKVVPEAFNAEVVDIIAAVTALMELYWVLDTKYADRNKNTLAFLERFCDLPSEQKAPLLLRAISAIGAWVDEQK